MKKNLCENPFAFFIRWMRMLRTMRNVMVLIVAFAFQANAGIFSQSRISVHLTNSDIEDLIRAIEEQTELDFLYDASNFKGIKPISVNAQNELVERVLDKALEDTGLSYEVEHKTVLIRVQERNANTAAQEKRKLKGKVVDENNVSLPGVSVIIKGSSIGTTTNIDGEYEISLDDKPGQVLIFSFIGLEAQEINITNQTFLNVTLKSSTEDLEEVVVTGYQKIDRKLFTGSAAKVKIEEVKLDGVPDASRALQGTVAGVEIENVSGTFGAAPVIRVRGNASINGSNKPLWVVDGVVMEDAVEITNEDLTSGNLNTILSSALVGINPEDIESFQVLKDASATALYGARAMNGVVVITTKKGVAQKTRVNYTSSFTVKSKPTYSQFDIMNSGSEMEVYQELNEKGWLGIAEAAIARSHGAMGKMYDKIAKRELEWGPNGSINYDYLQSYADANTDWFDELFRNSLQQQHSVSINGGNEKSKVYASVGYLNDSGQTIADNVKNYTGQIKADFKLSDKVRVGLKLSGNVRDQKLPGSKDREFNAVDGVYERNFDINPFNYALYTSRSTRPRDENGNPEFFRRDYAPFNILHELDHNYVDVDVNELIFQADLTYKFTKNLNFKSAVQGRWYGSKAEQTIHENSNQAAAYRADDPLFREKNRYLFSDRTHPEKYPYSVLPQGGFLKTTDHSLNSYYMRNSIDWSFTKNDSHVFNFLLGHEIRYNDRVKSYNEGWGYLFDKGGLVVSHPDFVKFLDDRGLDYFFRKPTRGRYVSFFLTGAYSYMGKYILNATANYAGDNRTGKSRNARYLPTWNVSGAWNISEENWFDKSGIVDMLKVKATYGLSGDNPVGASGALTLYGSEPLRPTPADRETVLVIDDLENGELTFEKLYEFSAGIEVALLKNRIYAEFEYYRRNSKDLLGIVETNGVGGIQYKYGNIGEMKVNGFEATLRTMNIETPNFKWSSMFTFSYGKDKITKWENRARIGDAVQMLGTNLKGYSRGSLFSIPFAGLDSNGVPRFYGPDGKTTQYVNWQEREDIEKYLKYEGPTTPRGYGGLTNSFSYKNLSLSFSLIYRYGNKIRLDNVYSSSYSDYQALPGELINRWQFKGDEKITKIPAILDISEAEKLDEAGLNPYELYNMSTERVADGDFIRLKDVKISYSFPKRMLKKTFIEGANLSLQAYNLWLLYSDDKLNGIDPEFYQSGGISLPLSRTYTFSLNLKF
ncbi:SusC/RagA family TonB-linked outer membrane protein [Marinifilum sp. D737]|uniref:SusC/RagA family TonB-linked outer membrane protein n=1 Tax=Marinifilum sp. D737 TaxID=2969628 RepID=UPI0022742FEE|nr:SusC/RagA family TonB-linked outer membrane protein [Marinifilum sp. D737]MCY1633434.1 SusC/RagA family TonB-linked outer membrane protein [Marinifilum sp. D737]